MKKRVKAATKHARAKRAGLAAWGGYEAQLVRQNNGCAVCGKRPGTRRLHVDHDHLTGQARGLLCWQDNAILGRARDEAWRLQAAAIYLTYGWEASKAFREAERP